MGRATCGVLDICAPSGRTWHECLPFGLLTSVGKPLPPALPAPPWPACRGVLVPLVIKSVRSLRSSVCKVRAPAAEVQAACLKHARSEALPIWPRDG